MHAEDLTVTVRDKTLARIGVIPSHLLEATFIIRDTAVGDWKLRLPADHPMAALLRTPGYGIIVDGPDGTLFSGPMVKSTRDSDYRDESGIVTVKGVTDEIVLWDALAYPPADFAYDTFTGEPWEIFDHFIDFNLGDLTRFPTGSFASLLTTDFSAVTNLVPNPDPTAPDEGSGYGLISNTDWADDSGASDGFKIINLTFGPTGYSDSSYESVHRTDTTPCEYWPVDTGTGGIAVTAASSYDLSVHVGGNEFTTTLTATVKCRWYNSAGTLLSTSAGSAVNCTTSGPAWDNSGTPATGYVSANPSETFTAPTSAAYAQPFVELSWPSATSRGVWVAAWVMQVN